MMTKMNILSVKRITGMLVLLTAIVLASPGISSEKTAGEWLNEGVDNFYAGEYEKAIDCYTEAIKLDAGNAIAYHNRGAALMALGEYEGAIEDFDEVIRLEPDYIDAYFNRGLAYYELSQDEKAIEDFTIFTEISPERESAIHAVEAISDSLIGSFTIPDNIFGHYKAWPPDSITQEEVDLLNHIAVYMETTAGTMVIRLFPDEAPIHSTNFVKLVQDGFYDGLPFHRVIVNFMSQGGDPEGTGSGGPGYTLPAEIELPHVAGSLAAARTADQVNPERRSSGSQFYIVHTDTSCVNLNGNYTVFGQVIEGLDVNTSLLVNYSGSFPTPDAKTDRIIRCWLEYL